MAGTGLPTGGNRPPVLLDPSPLVQPDNSAAQTWGALRQTADAATHDFSRLAAQAEHASQLKWAADFELEARGKRIELQTQFADDPESFKREWQAFTDGKLGAVPLKYADHARHTLGKEGLSSLASIEGAALTKTKALAADAVKARLDAAQTDVLGYAYRGEAGGEPFTQAMLDYRAYLNDGVRAGLWSQELADNKTNELAGKAKAESIVGMSKRLFDQKGMEGGYAEAERLLSDPSMKLDPREVEQYRGRISAEMNKWAGFQSADRQKLAVEADILKDKFKVGTATEDEVKGLAQRAVAVRDYKTASDLTRGYARQETLANEAWKPPADTEQTISTLQDKARATPPNTIAITQDDKEALIRTALAEAGNQGADGLAGVIYTVLNRTRHPAWGGSVSDVVNAKNQFEPVGRAGGDWRNLPTGTDQQRAEAGRLIDEISAGQRPDPTGGATYFLNRKISAERGTDFGVGKDQFKAAEIGDHTFYRPGLFGESATPVPGYSVRPGVDPDLIRDLETANTKKMEALKSDPLGYVSRLRGAPALPAVDWTKPDATAAALQERQRISAATSSMFKIDVAPVLTKPELDQMKATWNQGDSGTRARIVGTLARSLDGKHLTSTLEKVAGDNPVFASAGLIYQQNPELALSIVRGTSYIDADKKILPPEKNVRTEVNDFLGTAASSMPQARAAIEQAALARYADLSAGAKDFSGAFDSSRMQQALRDVTGGVVSWGQGTKLFGLAGVPKIIPPKPGMTDSEFGKLIDSLTDADLTGMTTGSGTQIKASEFRRLASLHDAGPGRYMVEIGGGFARGTDGQPFVLDLSRKVQ